MGKGYNPNRDPKTGQFTDGKGNANYYSKNPNSKYERVWTHDSYSKKYGVPTTNLAGQVRGSGKVKNIKTSIGVTRTRASYITTDINVNKQITSMIKRGLV